MDIILEKGDAALVFKANGDDIDLIIPEHEDHDVVPENVLCASAVAARFAEDPEWVSALVQWLKDKNNELRH